MQCAKNAKVQVQEVLSHIFVHQIVRSLAAHVGGAVSDFSMSASENPLLVGASEGGKREREEKGSESRVHRDGQRGSLDDGQKEGKARIDLITRDEGGEERREPSGACTVDKPQLCAARGSG